MLVLEHGAPEILFSDNGKEFTNDNLAHVWQELNIEHFASPYTPRSNGKTENFNKFLKASIRKLCQEDTASWDQVTDQISFAYWCCPHTSTSEAPYTLPYNRDPPLPVQRLIKCVEPYKGDNLLGKRIEQLRITLFTAARMLEKISANQKRHYQNRRATHKFQVGDLVLLKKWNDDKMDLIWEPTYRVIKLPSPWSAVVENQTNSVTKRWNVGDLKLKRPSEDWELKPSPIGRAAKFVNYPDNLPDVDIKPNAGPILVSDSKEANSTRYQLRRSIRASKKLDL